HLRRVQAVTAPSARHALEAAAQEKQDALDAWYGAGGTVDVDTALALRNEVIVFAARLTTSAGAASEIDDLRQRLTDEIEPEATRQRAALVGLLSPYGIDAAAVDDPTPLAPLVRQQVALGRRARAQAVILRAEADARHLADGLDGELRDLGFRDGTLPD